MVQDRRCNAGNRKIKKIYKVEEYANSRKVLGSKIRTIWDKVEIDGAIYGWNEKRSEIYKV